ncbi:hypothetical protein CRI94_15015 [Longibacter salinarum]|uniref:Uncharacterized protein n=1 Tax=Longibacter salinarum TaxID=1850348 RepID=A0A2A8CUV4_9BACT|nr:hypothetical protein CRI94_15015 [Longibacter salinarum]
MSVFVSGNRLFLREEEQVLTLVLPVALWFFRDRLFDKCPDLIEKYSACQIASETSGWIGKYRDV